MQYPIIDNLIYAYLKNGWTGSTVKNLIQIINPNINGITPNTSRGIESLTINSGFSFTVNRTGDDYIGEIPYSTGTRIINGIYASVKPNTTYTLFNFSEAEFNKNYYAQLNSTFDSITSYVSIGGTRKTTITTGETANYVAFRFGSQNLFQPGELYTTRFTLVEDDVTSIEYDYTDMMYNDIAHRLKLPLPHYFPHPVIDALQRAAAGTQTADDTEILQHYLTRLGIGGI